MPSIELHATLITILFVVDVLASIALWRTRKERTIELRCVPAMLSCVWLSYLAGLADNMGAIYADFSIVEKICWQYRIKLVYEHQSVVTMLFAAYRVVFFMELSAHLAQTRDVQSRAKLLAGPGGWYVTHKHWMDWKYNRWFFLSQGLLMLAIVLSFSTFDDGCGTTYAFRYLSGLIALLYLACTIYLIYRLSKWGRDAFGIKVDLARMAFCGAVIKVVNTILFVKNKEGADQQEAEGILEFFLAISMTACLAISPVVRVWRQCATMAEPTMLEDLIKRPSGYESFLEFLNSEFASESLHFWNTVNMYHSKFPTMPDIKDRLEYANEITETFVRPNAVLEVNITGTARAKIYDTISAYQKYIMTMEAGKDDLELLTVFDAAQAEIMRLMSQDNFRRYLKSPQFAAWKQHSTSTRFSSSTSAEDASKSSTNQHQLALSVTQIPAARDSHPTAQNSPQLPNARLSVPLGHSNSHIELPAFP